MLTASDARARLVGPSVAVHLAAWSGRRIKRNEKGAEAMFWTDVNPPTVSSLRWEEGRRYARKAYSGVVVRLDPRSLECGAVDLSAGGVGILSRERLELGELVHLAFMGRSVSVRGVVSHVRPMSGGDWRVGVSFLREEPELAEVALAAV